MSFIEAISEEDKKVRLEAFGELLDRFIAVYSKHIQDNGNTGHLFGNSLSFADIVTYVLFKNVVLGLVKFKTDIADYTKPKLTPEIIKLISTVETDPKLIKFVLKSGNLSAAVRA
ncbi:hypothetical protein H4S08_004155 [Coemansia sp. RSA 1365]|nr:hypothetical protein H4S08_004155 [Coemansia sp. RSA 1365]